MPQDNTLNQVPLFSGLDESQQQEIARISVKKKFAKDEMIFWQDAEAEGFYIVLSGKVKVFKLSIEGREQILQIFGPGEPIGEVPVFAGQTFPAYAQAIEESELQFFPRNRLRLLIQQDPSLAMNMLAVLSKRLREFTKMIEDLSLKELPARLAAYIMYQQDARNGAEEIALEVSKGVLSKILGTSQESLSRILRKMSDAQIISVDRRNIQILDRQRLESLADGVDNLT